MCERTQSKEALFVKENGLVGLDVPNDKVREDNQDDNHPRFHGSSPYS